MAEGETTSVVPVPSGVPPHELLYQAQSAPVPSVPPETLSVVLPPWQMVGVLAAAEVGAADGVLYVTVTAWQAVVLQVPDAFT